MTLRHTLDRLGLDPKKSLGQNFMIEPAALAKLADAADLSPANAVLEIGAGTGALTDYLAARARRVVAVEIDGRFIPHLEAHFANQPSGEIVQADILDIDLPSLLGADAARYTAVGNLPYYVTTAILRHLLESDTPPRLMSASLRSECTFRITAAPPDMSLL